MRPPRGSRINHSVGQRAVSIGQDNVPILVAALSQGAVAHRIDRRLNDDGCQVAAEQPTGSRIPSCGSGRCQRRNRSVGTPMWLMATCCRLGWAEMEELGPSTQRDVLRCDLGQ